MRNVAMLKGASKVDTKLGRTSCFAAGPHKLPRGVRWINTLPGGEERPPAPTSKLRLSSFHESSQHPPSLPLLSPRLYWLAPRPATTLKRRVSPLPHSQRIADQQHQQPFLSTRLSSSALSRKPKRSFYRCLCGLRDRIAMASVAVGTKRTFSAMIGDTARNGDWASPARSSSSHGPDRPRVLGVEGTCK